MHPTQKRTKVSVLLTDGEFGRLDRYCAEQGFKKSTLIARLIRDHLDAEESGQHGRRSADNSGR